MHDIDMQDKNCLSKETAKNKLADYLQTFGLSIWSKKNFNEIESQPELEIVLDDKETDPALKGSQLHNCGCGSGSSCNASC